MFFVLSLAPLVAEEAEAAVGIQAISAEIGFEAISAEIDFEAISAEIGFEPVAAEEPTLTEHFYSEYVRAFLNNEFLQENLRLIGVAVERYDGGYYDDAIVLALEAMRYAQLSDEYVAMQMRIRAANEAISAAEFRLEWARRAGAPTRYAELYESAEGAFASALDDREIEEWDSARAHALRVVEILAGIAPTLPAQFLVRTWAGTRDCLWNIAALPEVFGDATRWPLLYQANRGRMPRPGDPDLILPGMILDIPSIAGEIRYGLMDESWF